MKKQTQITLVLIILIVLIAVVVIYIKNQNPGIPADLAKCIGSKSELYVKLGCTHCEDQKKMFGDSLKYLNVTDCWYERDFCLVKGIEKIPTWVINRTQYTGVQEIETLKNLTGC